MGKIDLNKKYKSYTGKLPPNNHRLYITKRFGETVISHCPEHRDPASVTQAQRRAFALITQASALADADLRDGQKREEWLRRRNADFAASGKYKTLRGYVIASYRQHLNDSDTPESSEN